MEQTFPITANVSVLFWKLIQMLSIDNLMTNL